MQLIGRSWVISRFDETLVSVGDSKLVTWTEVAAGRAPLNPVVVPDCEVSERKGTKCVRRGLERMRGKAEVGRHADCETEGEDKNEESFVDIIIGVLGEEALKSEGFAFADALRLANTLLEAIDPRGRSQYIGENTSLKVSLAP